MANFRDLVEHLSAEILDKWIDYFVLHRKVESPKRLFGESNESSESPAKDFQRVRPLRSRQCQTGVWLQAENPVQ